MRSKLPEASYVIWQKLSFRCSPPLNLWAQLWGFGTLWSWTPQLQTLHESSTLNVCRCSHQAQSMLFYLQPNFLNKVKTAFWTLQCFCFFSLYLILQWRTYQLSILIYLFTVFCPWCAEMLLSDYRVCSMKHENLFSRLTALMSTHWNKNHCLQHLHIIYLPEFPLLVFITCIIFVLIPMITIRKV